MNKMGFSLKRIGSNIYYLRRKKRFTISDLAEKFEVSEMTINNWQSGKKCPSIDHIYELSEFFKVSIDDLVKKNLIDIELER